MRRAAVVLGVLALLAVGCRRRPGANDLTPPPADLGLGIGGVDLSAARRPPVAGWPRVMVVAPSQGPALFLGPGESDPAIGYLEPGVRVRVESAPIRDRVEVLVSGQLPARGWVPAARLGAYVRHRQRVEGTAAYLGSNNIVSLVSRSGETYTVAVRPFFRDGAVVGPFTATLPVSDVSDRPFEETDALTEGECWRLPAGQTLPLYDRVGGEEVATLPALDPPLELTVLRRQETWFGVRAGLGPFLTGFVRGALMPCEPTPSGLPVDGTPVWMGRESGQLFRVAAGTRVSFNGQTIARLRDVGWARALGRADLPMVDVFLAVDDAAAIRGLVPRGALTPAGAMDRTVVAAQVRPRLEAAQECYLALRATQSDLAGRVSVRFMIEADGLVSDPRVTANPTGSEELGACVTDAITDLRFEPPPEGGPVAVEYPIEFAPPAAPTPAPAPSEAEVDLNQPGSG